MAKVKNRSSLQIFISVIKALFLRELNRRISTGKIGLFWTFFEPFFQVLALMYIRIAIRGAGASGSSFDFAVFFASGFIAFNMFRNILNSSKGAFSANKALFVYKQVKPIDTIIARVLVEMFLTSVIIILFLFVGFLLHHDIKPENFVMVVAGYLWLVLFSFSVGLLAAIGNIFFVSVGKVIGLMSFPLLIFSAVLYPLESLPQEAINILLYNPLVHFMEMIHSNYIYQLSDRYVDYIYMLKWTVTPLFIGLWLYVRLEKRIISL